MIVRRTKDAAEGRLSLPVYSEVCCRSHSYFEDVAGAVGAEIGQTNNFVSSMAVSGARDELPSPDGPLTIGIDAGYVRGRHKQGQLGVIAGKSLLATALGKCFALAQAQPTFTSLSFHTC
jgi:hypothetical protein